MANPVIYLDMDGVIADFIERLLWQHGRGDLVAKYERGEFPNDWLLGGELGTEEDIWKPVTKAGEYFWTEINPYPWTHEVVEAVRRTGLDWYICTTPYTTPHSYSGKIKWLDKHIGKYKVIMMKDKYLLAHDNAVLIDDNDRNCDRFEEAGGHSILFPQPWNENRNLIDKTTRVFHEELETWFFSEEVLN